MVDQQPTRLFPIQAFKLSLLGPTTKRKVIISTKTTINRKFHPQALIVDPMVANIVIIILLALSVLIMTISSFSQFSIGLSLTLTTTSQQALLPLSIHLMY